jgi:hypothetical protein
MSIMRTCRHCGNEFTPYCGKPGRIDECPEHSREDVERISIRRLADVLAAPGEGDDPNMAPEAAPYSGAGFPVQQFQGWV